MATRRFVLRGALLAWLFVVNKNLARNGYAQFVRSGGSGEVRFFSLLANAAVSIFDVAKAKQITSDGRPAQVIDPDVIRQMLIVTSYDKRHLAHVDPVCSGIVGQRISGPFLLDGGHRAVRCLEERMPFHAFILNPEETRRCLLVQDISESDIGLSVQAIRKLLTTCAESEELDIELECSSEAIAQIKRLLTKKENARVRLRVARSLESRK